MFKIIRIYDFIKSQYRDDFYGVFIDRLYPRGIKKEIFNSFLRLKEISPSNKLRAWFHEDKEARFQEFKTEFKKELKTPEAIKALKTLNAQKYSAFNGSQRYRALSCASYPRSSKIIR